MVNIALFTPDGDIGGEMINTNIWILHFPSPGVEEGPPEYGGPESNHPHPEEAQGEEGRREETVRLDFQQNGKGQ